MQYCYSNSVRLSVRPVHISVLLLSVGLLFLTNKHDNDDDLSVYHIALVLDTSPNILGLPLGYAAILVLYSPSCFPNIRQHDSCFFLF